MEGVRRESYGRVRCRRSICGCARVFKPSRGCGWMVGEVEEGRLMVEGEQGRRPNRGWVNNSFN